MALIRFDSAGAGLKHRSYLEPPLPSGKVFGFSIPVPQRWAV